MLKVRITENNRPLEDIKILNIGEVMRYTYRYLVNEKYEILHDRREGYRKLVWKAISKLMKEDR